MESASTIWDVLPDNISKPVLDHDPFWENYEREAISFSVHVAILSKVYLELIFDREKTIESRFSVHRRIPYLRVRKGDAILLKERSGPIKGVAYASQVWFFELKNGTLKYIQEQFGDALQIQEQSYWDTCAERTYATLIELQHVRRIDPIQFVKRDRNAWIIFEPSLQT